MMTPVLSHLNIFCIVITATLRHCPHTCITNSVVTVVRSEEAQHTTQLLQVSGALLIHRAVVLV